MVGASTVIPSTVDRSRLSHRAAGLLAALFEEDIRYIALIDAKRKALVKRKRFNIDDLFCQIDVVKRRKLSLSDVGVFLRRQRIHLTKRDLELLFLRLDADLDGTVSYLEFVRAVLPKGERRKGTGLTMRPPAIAVKPEPGEESP
jgi:hypothetical protein